MKKFKYYFCNEAGCWRDELSKEDLEVCANDGHCVICEVASGFDNKDDLNKDDDFREEAAEAALKGSLSEIRGSHNVDMDNHLTASIINTMVEAGKEALLH